ncbi:MAG: spore coat protein [Peptococcaceae bacterium BRH_c4a]|nr:MAG: spore coat protein [Peptococcaceae bacterium BRH_c4a]
MKGDIGVRLLVTGGLGFIGSNFVRYSIKKNHRVVNLDMLTYAGNPENLGDIECSPAYRLIRGDIADTRLIEKTIGPDIDAVVNFAAESHVDRSISDPAPFIKTNVLGTQTLLKAVLKANLLNKSRQGSPIRFIQVSTDEVYGSLGTEGCFTEESPLSPNNPYSASKAAADLLALSYHRTYGLPVIITRCSNNYGPYQYPEKLIPLAITNALRDIPIPIYGDGLYTRDWVHVQDHCRAIEMVAASGAGDGEVFNIGGGNERTNIEIATGILRILNKPLTLLRFVEDRSGHDRRYAVNYGKILDRLGWRPEMPFSAGLEETVGWYVKNARWWEGLKNRERQYQALN